MALELDLPAIVIAHLAARGAARSGPRTDTEATAALLTSRRYPAHGAVLAFEAAYGGLQLFESDPDVAALVVGPYACFETSPTYTGGLLSREIVPVIFACNDVEYGLDADGRGFTLAAMVEGVWRSSAPDGRTLLTQAILWRALETRSASFGFHEGLQGSALATTRGLPEIAEAAGDTERWWGDGEQLVVEIDRGNGFEHPMTFATT
jgi:hypothetical protein